MLVLSRKIGERIHIGDNITLVVNRIAGNRVTLGIEAPAEVRIVRSELAEAVHAFAGGGDQDEAFVADADRYAVLRRMAR